jgi:hypothetical protein
MSRGKKTTLIVTGIIALLYIPFYLYGFNSPVHAIVEGGASINCGTYTHRLADPLPAGDSYLNGVTCADEFHRTEQAAIILSPIVLPFLLALLIFGGPAIVILGMGIIGAPGGVVGSMTEVSPGRWHLRFWR